MWNTTPVRRDWSKCTPCLHDHVEEVFDGEDFEPVVFEMVRRDQVLGGAFGGQKTPRSPS